MSNIFKSLPTWRIKPETDLKTGLIWLFLCTLSVLLLGLSASLGSEVIHPHQLWLMLTGQDQSSQSWQIVSMLRWPRACTAFVCGGLLALSGHVLQIILKNPLADPYILGTSSGASLGSMLALWINAAVWEIQAASAVGAATSTLLVMTLCRTFWKSHGMNSASSLQILLVGVLISSGCGACVALILAVSPDASLRSMMFWLMGDLSHNPIPGESWLMLLILLIWAMRLASSLNLMMLGARQAHSLGIHVPHLRFQIIVLASLSTGLAVSLAGNIGFIGLLVPHASRMLLGPDQKMNLPAGVLLGGCLLTLADLLARTLVSPLQLPVGVLVSLLGVPCFLFLLLSQHHKAPVSRE